MHILNGDFSFGLQAETVYDLCSGPLLITGGITKWMKEKRRVETGELQKVVAGSPYKAQFNEALVVSWEDVLAKIGSDTQIVDARGAARFYAKDPVRQ